MPERVLLSTLTLTRDLSNTRAIRSINGITDRLFELNALVTAENDQGNSYPLGELGKVSMGEFSAC
ncbi:MAG TPA: hypothetical protein VFX43_21465 [Chitinophagaceae bacterium]|nr:hypothetical protein [Chitinophagaceae bacterium]